jgi:hypothetical protein
MAITGTIIIRNGKIGIKLDPGQELGKKCHALNDVLLPGVATKRQAWEDDPNRIPDQEQFQAQQHRR